MNRDRLLTAWANAATGHPWLVLITAVVLAIGAIALTAGRLEFRADRDSLIDPTLDWQQRYAAFKQSFPRWDDAIVVVDATSAPDEAIDGYLDALAARLRADDRFERADAGFDADEAPAGLLLAEPVERVREVAQESQRAAPALGAQA
ncbi:MAG: hypothetical protein VYC34_10770, partial [Planctomycetota bacterium]|nr:hypothetical protein [Planctomycetota bacterium]